MMEFVFDKLQYIVGKGDKAGNQHFLQLQCFQKANYSG